MEKINSYPLASSSWDQKELDAIHNVIHTDMYTMGNYVAKFEEAFAQFTGSKYSVMVNSGSSANLLMVAALFYTKCHRLKAGDEAIVPAVSWPTTYYPLYQYGLKLKFVDIDLKTLNYDLESLQSALSDKTRLIMAVNLLGNPNDFARIEAMIEGKDIILIEDNCESMGALFEYKQAGTHGLMGSFSSFFSHHMSTMEGGILVTDDEELYQILICLRAHGWTRNLPHHNLVCGEKSDKPFEESFRFVLPGYNVRPLEMMGAIGLAQLEKLPQFLEERKKNAQYFIELFHSSPHFYIQEELGISSWFGFALIIKPDVSIDRHALTEFLRENQIDCRPIVAGNFTKNEVLKYFNYELHGEMKNADYIDQYGFFVGNHQFNIQREILYLHQTITKFIKGGLSSQVRHFM